MVHVLEKLFTEPSMANMLFFCGSTFLGLSGIAILLVLDVISQSEVGFYRSLYVQESWMEQYIKYRTKMLLGLRCLYCIF